MTSFGPSVLDLDCAEEASWIEGELRRLVGSHLRRRGLVLGVSGGLDSAVCLALATRAVGPDRVVALMMPDRDTPAAATQRATRFAQRLGVRTVTEDVDPSLEALGCYRRRDAAVRQLFPDLQEGSRSKITVAGELLEKDRLPYFNLVVEAADGEQVSRRMPPEVYLNIVAATNMKQRVRKLLEYTHAESLNYAVLGTPNRLEFALGFFVRGGDGLADVKPIAHLYKLQVFAMAAFLEVDEEIRATTPSTDTYGLAQTQEEFYFGMSLAQLDLLLYAYERQIPGETVASGMGLSTEQVERAFHDIASKRRAAARGLEDALLVRPVTGHG
jgi:NAD+ synthase